MSRAPSKRTVSGLADIQGSRRSIKSAERRRRVLLAANHFFSRHGFRKTTVDVIAREAEVSKALVFAFFGDKETLYDAVIQETLRTWTGFAEQQSARHHDSPDLELASLFRGSFEFANHTPMLRVLMARREREIQGRGESLPQVDRAWRGKLSGRRRDAREHSFSLAFDRALGAA